MAIHSFFDWTNDDTNQDSPNKMLSHSSLATSEVIDNVYALLTYVVAVCKRFDWTSFEINISIHNDDDDLKDG